MKYESQYYGVIPFGESISHHGIKGMKWGVRRYQNEDGSYTDAGKKRRKILTPERKEKIKAVTRNVKDFSKGAAMESAKIAAVLGGISLAHYLKESSLSERMFKEITKRQNKNRDPFSGYRVTRKSDFSDLTMDDLRKLDLW